MKEYACVVLCSERHIIGAYETRLFIIRVIIWSRVLVIGYKKKLLFILLIQCVVEIMCC